MTNTTIKEALKKVDAVYDNPAYPDRYAVFMKNGKVYTMSKNPMSPDGTNKYAGTTHYCSGAREDKRLDKNKLPPEVKEAIRDRVQDN